MVSNTYTKKGIQIFTCIYVQLHLRLMFFQVNIVEAWPWKMFSFKFVTLEASRSLNETAQSSAVQANHPYQHSHVDHTVLEGRQSQVRNLVCLLVDHHGHLLGRTSARVQSRSSATLSQNSNGRQSILKRHCTYVKVGVVAQSDRHAKSPQLLSPDAFRPTKHMVFAIFFCK